MPKQKTTPPKYTIRVSPDPSGALRYSFSPKKRPGESVSEFVARVEGDGKVPALSWVNPPKDAAKAELEELALARFAERAGWLRRVADLVDTVEKWSREMGWAVKRIEKRIEDPRLGDHKAAALVMQDDLTRMALEPVSATALGADGVVDLYLMPGWDDIASLYHEEGGWQLHYGGFPLSGAVSPREAAARKLTKKAFAEVLDEMKKHAA